MSARGGFREEACPGGHTGPPLRGVGSVREPTGIGGKRCLSQRGGTELAPYRGSGAGGRVQDGGVWSPRPMGATQVVPSNGPMWASAPTESPINHPSQPARSEASAPAAARDGRESAQRPSQKGGTAAVTAWAALSEAESAERGAGQIRFLPDTLRVQHGVPGLVAC